MQQFHNDSIFVIVYWLSQKRSSYQRKQPNVKYTAEREVASAY